jgi:phosphatidylserine/phosphatidylglycerophosphate/cardiolipin synthase-like enzyme
MCFWKRNPARGKFRRLLTNAPAPPPAIEQGAPPEQIPLNAGYGFEGGWYQLYFSEPFSPSATQQSGGIDVPLIAAIDSARQSVDVAIYSISLPSIVNAIMDAHQRGVRVRMVMESDSMDRSGPQRLMDTGIRIVGDLREGLMHNKFVIIDGAEVWIGSANFTPNGIYQDNNHILRVRSTKIAQNYITEFEEMFEQDKFGTNIVSATPNAVININGVVVENYFSPDDGVARRINALLGEAQESIFFMAYSFTSDDFSATLQARAANGVNVSGVFEEEQVKSNMGGEYETLRLAGLDVYLDGNSGQMHHKVFIIDQQIVILGSYNFSANAEKRNDENVMIIHDRDFAALFMAEFERVYRQAQP